MRKNYLTHTHSETQHIRTMKSSKKFFLRTLLFFLLVNSCTLFAQQTKVMSLRSPWVEKELNEEITSKRSRTAKHFLVSGNKISAFISPASIHYMEKGKWEEINTDIVGHNSPGHPYASTRNAIKTYFPFNPFSDYIIMQSKEGEFKEKILAVKFLDAADNVVGTLPVSGNISTVVEGNKISYTGFYPNVSLFYAMGNDQRKFNFVIESAAFLNVIPPGATSIVIEEEFISDNHEATIIQNETETLVTVKGEQVLSFSEPVGFDSNTLEEDLLNGTLSVQKKQHSFSIVTSFPLTWIMNNARVFPIQLDPTVNYYPQNVTMWTGYQASNTGKTDGLLRLTGNTTASWAKFDLSTLPVGAAITQADYYGYHYTSSVSKIAEIRGLQTLDPVPAAAGTLFTQSYSGPLYNGNYNFATTTFGWNIGSLTGTALSDIAAAAGNWFALGFGYLSGSATFAYQYGWNAASSSNINYVEITYFTTPCSGVPVSNTITPAVFSTCPGIINPNLSMVNSYTVGGLNYQWHISNASAVGPWTVIPNGTLSAVQIPTLGTSSWIQAVVTCTNPGGGTYSLTASQIIVAGTTTNTVPYYEDFEGIYIEDRLPNCSWSSANLGVTVDTYTAAASDNRIPKSGNNFATFGLPSNNSHVFTNGIQMTAGVTYSAALFYATEYMGYSNWTELSILVGTSQSTTGLIPVASVGPVVSGSYKLLSGLFTVPATGLYYVAIKASSSSGSALYISWDDLSVTIPCYGGGAANAPTVNITTSSQTVCSGVPLTLTASGADTYMWSSGSTNTVITEYPVALGPNNYVVTGTNQLTGCSGSYTQTIFVNPSPVVLTTAYPSIVCEGQPITLNAVGNAISYLWSNGSTSASNTFTTNAAGSHTVIGTAANGCITSAVQAFGVHQSPSVSASSDNPAIACKDDLITLTGSGALTYEWISNTSPNVLQGASVFVTLSGITVFTVTGTDGNGCSGKATILQDVSECLGINNNSQELSGLKVYPNPANTEFTVELNSTSLKTLELADLTGRLILTENSYDEKIKVNISALSNGIYYAKIRSNDSSAVIKIIKGN